MSDWDKIETETNKLKELMKSLFVSDLIEKADSLKEEITNDYGVAVKSFGEELNAKFEELYDENFKRGIDDLKEEINNLSKKLKKVEQVIGKNYSALSKEIIADIHPRIAGLLDETKKSQQKSSKLTDKLEQSIMENKKMINKNYDETKFIKKLLFGIFGAIIFLTIKSFL